MEIPVAVPVNAEEYDDGVVPFADVLASSSALAHLRNTVPDLPDDIPPFLERDVGMAGGAAEGPGQPAGGRAGPEAQAPPLPAARAAVDPLPPPAQSPPGAPAVALTSSSSSYPVL